MTETEAVDPHKKMSEYSVRTVQRRASLRAPAASPQPPRLRVGCENPRSEYDRFSNSCRPKHPRPRERIRTKLSTPSRPDVVKQFPGPSLPKPMAQFRFAFRFSYWCMLSPQPCTRTVPVLGRTVATLRPVLARMPWRSAGHRRTPGLQV